MDTFNIETIIRVLRLEHLSPRAQRVAMALYVGTFGGTFLHITFLGFFAWFDVTILAIINIFSIATFVAGTIMIRHGKTLMATFMCYIEIYLHAIISTPILGWDSGFAFYLIPCCLFVLLVPAFKGWRKYAVVLTNIITFMCLWAYCELYPPEPLLKPNAEDAAYFFNLGGTFIANFLAAAFFYSTAEHSQNELEHKLEVIEAQSENLWELNESISKILDNLNNVIFIIKDDFSIDETVSQPTLKYFGIRSINELSTDKFINMFVMTDEQKSMVATSIGT